MSQDFIIRGTKDSPVMQATEFVEEHLERFIGPIYNRLGQFPGADLDAKNIQLNVIEPNDANPFYTIATVGMSNISMPSPEHRPANIELLIRLPHDWDFSEPVNTWPLQHLRDVCWFVYSDKTWLGIGHTIPNDEPIGPGTTMSGFLISFPYLSPVEFMTLDLGLKQISFFSLLPIYEEEMDFKLKNGSDALYDLLEENNVTDLWNLKRTNLCKR